MIDMHCHVLPGIDDGCSNIDESIQMIKEARDCGYNVIYCSSHYYEPHYVSSKEKNLKLIKDLEEELKKQNIDVKLIPANEIYLNENSLSNLKAGLISTLNNSRYILIELPLNQELMIARKLVEELIDEKYEVIIAHPERYSYVQKNTDYLLDFLNVGAYFQSNYASITGLYGSKAQKTVKELLDRRLIQFLATDCHKPQTIYKNMDKIRDTLISTVDNNEYLKDISVLNPRNLLLNKAIIVEEPKPKEDKSFFGKLFKK